MRFAGTILLIIGIVLFWLITQQRHTPLGMQALQLETTIGFPPHFIAMATGILLWARTLLQRASPRSDNRTNKPDHRPIVQNPEDLTWVSDIISKARALEWEMGARLQFDLGNGIPFGLQLTHTTPEVGRRSLDQFSAFLHSIPNPPRVKVHYINAQTKNVPRHHSVRGALRRYFHQNEFHVVSQESWVDVIFHDPDPAWKRRPFLFLDRQ